MVRGLVPRELGDVRVRPRRYGIKVWFGPTSAPAKEHYEAQVIGAALAGDGSVLALEIGFHAEHPKVDDNDAVIDRLCQGERRWRRQVGAEAIAGPFLGRADVWRRISETWADPDLSEPDLGFEIGARLTDYIRALEPVRRGAPLRAGRRG